MISVTTILCLALGSALGAWITTLNFGGLSSRRRTPITRFDHSVKAMLTSALHAEARKASGSLYRGNALLTRVPLLIASLLLASCIPAPAATLAEPSILNMPAFYLRELADLSGEALWVVIITICLLVIVSCKIIDDNAFERGLEHGLDQSADARKELEVYKERVRRMLAEHERRISPLVPIAPIQQPASRDQGPATSIQNPAPNNHLINAAWHDYPGQGSTQNLNALNQVFDDQEGGRS